MQLECKHCNKLLSLPDDKLPIGRPFSFNCPYCKEKNTTMVEPPDTSFLAETRLPVDNQADRTPPQPPPPPAEAGFPAAGQNNQNEENGFADQDYQPPPPPTPLRTPAGGDAYSAVESFSGGDDEFTTSKLTLKQLLNGEIDERPKALIVYDDLDAAEMLEQKMDVLGFQVSVAMNLRDAAKQLKFANFSIVLIQEDYYGASLSGNHLLRALQSMEGASRRGMLVVMISPTLTTLDDLLAFSLSLDAIVNSSELANIERILISTIGRATKFYAVYREILAEHGLD